MNNISNDELAKAIVPDSVKVKLTKIRERDDAKTPNNISTGEYRIGYVRKKLLIPKIGMRYGLESVIEKNGEPVHAGHWFMTSEVVEIIDPHTFKTMNSIYRIEEV